MAKYKDRTLIRRQAPKSAFQLVAIGDREGLVAGDRYVVGHQVHDTAPSPSVARLCVTRMDQQPMDPGVEPIRIAKPRQLSPGDHQRLLYGVFGSTDVPEDPVRNCVQSIG